MMENRVLSLDVCKYIKLYVFLEPCLFKKKKQ